MAPLLLLIAGVFGDLWQWVAHVVSRIGDMSPYWLVLALALKTAESALIGLVWRNILRSSYPKSGVRFKTAWGASQGGTAINAVVPAQGGTAAMIGILRRNVPGSTVSGLTVATVVQSAFFLVLSVLIVIVTAVFRPRTVSKGSPSNETGGFFASHPWVVVLILAAVAALAYFVWPRVKPRVLDEWHKAKQGARIFANWRVYARDVAAPSAASYGCRVGVNVAFMAAFGIPITLFTVFLVASSHMLSQLFAITPGGVGQTQALDVATLRHYASSHDVAAFSITQDSVLTLWNVALGVMVLLWAFGWRQVRTMLPGRKRAKRAPDAPPAVTPR